MEQDDSGVPEFIESSHVLNALAIPTAIFGYFDPVQADSESASMFSAVPAAHSSYEGWAILWCNAVFEDQTGMSLDNLKLLGVEALRGVGGGRQMMQMTEPAVTSIDSQPLIFTRPTGEHVWTQVSFRRLPSAGPWAHLWVLTAIVNPVMQEVSDRSTLAAFRSEIERQANQNLVLVSRVSELLANVPAEQVLGTIADLLQRNVVARAEFMTMRRGKGLMRSIGFEADREEARDVRDPVALADPLFTIWLDNEAGTVQLTIPGDVDPDSPSGRVRAAFADDPQEPLTVLVTTAAGEGRSRGVLITKTHPTTSEHGEPDAILGPPKDGLRALLNLVARRVSVAMENYELYHREHVLAESLQRSMLPAQSRVRGLDIWTYYQPLSTFAQVGGDWYDIATREDGSISVILGDAVGHDVESVVAMSQIRTVIQALSRQELSPNELVTHVDAAIEGLRLSRTASLIIAQMVQSTDKSWTVTCTRAGHVPAIHVSAESAQVLDCTSAGLLGFPSGERIAETHIAQPGDALIFFTDGLVERRGHDMRLALSVLGKALGESQAPDAAGLGEEIMDLAEDAQDDVAVVVVRIPGGKRKGPGARARRWQLVSDPAAASQAREYCARALRQWGIENQESVLLTVSELVSNAVLHGWGTVGLRIMETDGGVRIEVEDANPTPPRHRHRSRSRSSDENVGGFGLHIIDRLGDWGWRPTPVGKVVWARIEV